MIGMWMAVNLAQAQTVKFGQSADDLLRRHITKHDATERACGDGLLRKRQQSYKCRSNQSS